MILNLEKNLPHHLQKLNNLILKDYSLLHKKLLEIVNISPYLYKHRWEKGDLVMWDNRCLLHRAVPYDMNNYRRVFRRTTVGGNSAIKGPYITPSKIAL